MRKANDVIGLRVLAEDTGEQLAKAKDVLCAPSRRSLVGLLVEDRGWFGHVHVLPLGDVDAVGPDAITVRSRDVIVSPEEEPDIKRVIDEAERFRGRKVLTTDGHALGRVTDVFFDEHTGTVEGYELSGGLLADFYVGRAFVPDAEVIQFGRDVAFLKPEATEIVEAQVHGLKGAIAQADKRLDQTADAMERKARSLGERAGRRWRETKSSLSRRLRDGTARARERAGQLWQRIKEMKKRRWPSAAVPLPPKRREPSAGDGMRRGPSDPSPD